MVYNNVWSIACHPNVEFSIDTLGNLNRHLQVTIMKTAMIAGILAITSFALSGQAYGVCPYDLNCINNPYGAGIHTKWMG